MKATEIKYLFLLHSLAANPGRTQADLARVSDVPLGLANRYVRRLKNWGWIEGREDGSVSGVSAKGREVIEESSWRLLDYVGGILDGLRVTAVRRMRAESARFGWKRAVCYGATPLAQFIGSWAAEAELEVVGVCDEERRGEGVLGLDDLAGLKFDCFIIADLDKADDRVLAALLRHYAPVMNLLGSDAAVNAEGVEHAFKLDA